METILKSEKQEIKISFDSPFTIIGEKINPTGRKKLADSNDVLNPDVPNGFPSVHRIEKMDVGTHISSRMWSGKFLDNQILNGDFRQPYLRFFAEEHLSVGQLANNADTIFEIPFVAVQDFINSRR